MKTLRRKDFAFGSRSDTLYARLMDMAVERGPGFKLPTTRELCDSFSASSVTVNHALNRLESQNIVVRKDRSGIFVSPKLFQKRIRIYVNSGLVMRNHLSPFWGILSANIFHKAQNWAENSHNEYEVKFLSAAEFYGSSMPEQILSQYNDGQIHGILVVGMDFVEETVFDIDASVPLVSYAGPGYWHVRADTMHAYDLAIRALAGRGCRRIAFWEHFISKSFDDLHEEADHSYVRGLLHDYGLPTDGILLHQIRDIFAGTRAGEELTYVQQGYMAAMRVFGQPGPKPDGLYITDDMLAQGVLAAFAKLGIKPGRDVTVATISNTGSAVLFGYDDDLILIEYSPSELVSTLFDVLEILMSGRVPAQQISLVSPNLVMPDERGEWDKTLSEYMPVLHSGMPSVTQP